MPHQSCRWTVPLLARSSVVGWGTSINNMGLMESYERECEVRDDLMRRILEWKCLSILERGRRRRMGREQLTLQHGAIPGKSAEVIGKASDAKSSRCG